MIADRLINMDENSHSKAIRTAYASKSDLDSAIKSKEHLMSILAVQGRMLLPPRQFCTWEFLRAVSDIVTA